MFEWLFLHLETLLCKNSSSLESKSSIYSGKNQTSSPKVVSTFCFHNFKLYLQVNFRKKLIIIFKMLQDSSFQEKNQKNQTQNDVFPMKSAFKRICSTDVELKNEGKRNTLNLDELPLPPSRQLSFSHEQKPSNYDGEAWHRAEIEKLFKLYDYYGPQWKIMSQQLPSRTANNLKNRFYTVLRNLIKLLFKKKSDTCPKLPGEIPSKDLSRLYDGKENYEEFKSLIPTILQELDFDLQNQNIDNVVQEYSKEIIKIYHTIYGQRTYMLYQQHKQNHKKSDEVSITFSPTSISSEKAEKFQKINHQISITNNRNIFHKNTSTQPQDYFYLFFFNPSQIFMPVGF